MTGTPFLIIVDDKHTDSISFGPTAWNTNTLAPLFNGTEQIPAFASNSSGQFGTISMNFQGTSIAFFGITPPVFDGSQILTVSIDGSEPTNTSYDDPNPPSYRQWYQSPTLTEGSHQISLSHIAGTSLDFAIVTVGNNTPLADQVAIVDNEDPAITFKGNWKLNEVPLSSGQFPDGLPFQNSTQDSTTIGDSLTFRFSGQSAAIYGIFTWSNLGLITLTLTLDGSSSSRTFQVTPTTPQFQTQFGQQQNFQFFSYDSLPPGNHTLVVNVTDCVNQTFGFDYITFTPSFSTLATRPNLPSLSSDPSSSHNLSLGAITGIVIAVIAVLLAAVLLLRWRLRKKKSYNIINPFPPEQPYTETFPLNDPNVSSSASVISHTSSLYSPIYVTNANAEFAAGGPRTSFISMDSARYTDPFHDQHASGEDDITLAEADELLPSYTESTIASNRRTAVNPQ